MTAMKILKICKALCLTVLTIMAAGCKGTWIMYDQEQKDHLYFEVTSATNVSFSLTEAKTMTQTVPVKMMDAAGSRKSDFPYMA